MAGIDEKTWRRRIAERSDLSTSVTHLTRPGVIDGEDCDFIKVLGRILRDRTIKGSTTQSGFIVGSTPAVCFQDAPLQGVVANVYYEQKLRETDKSAKVRYLFGGLSFDKRYAYKKGARPVIYDDTAAAKNYLPANQHWRIVRHDLSDPNAIIDWTHEREWRSPDSFEFELPEATVVLTNQHAYRAFVEQARKLSDEVHIDVLGTIKGIVVGGVLLY